MTVCAARCAGAADLPTTHGPQKSTPDASCSDCPLTYAGFTLYGTLDMGYGYDTAGIKFGKWYDKGVFYTIQKTSVAPRWACVSRRIDRLNGRREDGGAAYRRLASDRRGRTGL